MKAALPPQEAKRLDALRQYHILDTPPEQEFDDLTHLAAQICGTPVALITLIDEGRQWFKSKVGLDISETPRDISFCSHAILDHDLLLVPDATTDARFADNPLVICDPRVRFYAGMPLETSEGQNLGTLCVIDIVPRHLDAAQQDALRRLSRQVVTQLERRQAQAAALEAQRFLHSTLDALSSHIAVLDQSGKIIAVNEAWRQFLRENEGSALCCEIGANYIEVCERASGLWAEEAPAVSEGIREIIAGQRHDFCLEYPCHSPVEQRWFSVCVTRFADAGPVRVVVAHENITARKLSENLLAGEAFVLEKIATGEPLPAVLNELARMVEAQSPGLLCSILLLDEGSQQLQHGAGPSLPAQYMAAINGVKIGAAVGSCGTAAYEKRRVIVTDIATDPLWADYRDLAREHGLCACWSEPIFARQGQVLGTFALYYHEPRGPEPYHVRLIETAASLASVAIERSRADEQIRFQARLLDTVGQAVIATNLHGNIVYWNHFAETLYGWPAPEVLGQHIASVTVPEISREHAAKIMATISRGESWSGEFIVQRRNDTTFPAFITNEPIYDASGNLTGIIGVSIDATERKQTEAALRKSEQEQRRFAEHLEIERARLAEAQMVAKVGSWELDLRTNVLTWSDENYRIFGMSRSESGVSREVFLERVHPDDRLAVNRAYRESVANRMPYEIDHRVLMEDGMIKIVHERCWTFYDDEGRPLRSVGTTQDITERQQAEQELRASDARFFSIVANVPGMVYQFVMQPDGSIEWPFISEGCREICEMEPEEIQQNPLRPIEMIHPDDRPAFDALAAQSEQTLTPWKWEGRFVLPSGRTKWLEGASRPRRLSSGGTLWDGVLMDVTARKEAETEVERSLSLLQATLEATVDGILAVDEAGHVASFNRKFVELWRIPPEIMESQDDKQMLSFVMDQLENGDDFLARVQELYAHPEAESYDLLVFKDGRFFERHSRPQFIGGRSIGRVWSFRDVSQQRKAETALLKVNDELELHVVARTSELGKANAALRIENAERQVMMATLHQAADALEKAKQEADAANLAKSEFLSRMSHELRTPLNAILGFGQILDSDDLAPLEKESVEHILKGGRHLLTLINEILDIARVESGHIELSIEPIDLSDVVPESCSLVRPLAAQRSIRLDDNAASLGDIHVLADRQKLKQVLINLLSNGIKYNRSGGQVTVSCTHQPDNRIRIAVHDTGPGISPEGLAKLFTPFERLDAAKSEIEGSGLGLVLSQRLVEAMGGTLEVESVVGQGSIFSVEFAQAVAPIEALENSPASLNAATRLPAQRTYTVLYIEDNLSNLRLLEVVLQSRPEVTLLAAMQGSVGLDLARQHKPDLVLLDLNLPDISGKEVLSRLRQSPLTGEIPVIIISADATPPQIERLLAAGAKAYLTKPLNVADFLRALDETLHELSHHEKEKWQTVGT